MTQEQAVPAQSGELPPPMSDDDVLAYTRRMRIKVVKDLTATGSVSGENSDRILLTNMLKDLDSQALNSKKLTQDQKNNDNTAAVVAELLRTIDKNKAFTPLGDGSARTVDVEARVVPHSIGDIPALPGELDVTPPQLDYATFVRSQGKDADQLGKDAPHSEARQDDDDGMP